MRLLFILRLKLNSGTEMKNKTIVYPPFAWSYMQISNIATNVKTFGEYYYLIGSHHQVYNPLCVTR